VASLSNSEPEYIAAAEGEKDASWIRQSLEEMKVRQPGKPVHLVTDNVMRHKNCKIMCRMSRFNFYVSMVFSKDIFSAAYMEYIKKFFPHSASKILSIPAPNLIYFQARVFQQKLGQGISF
jgi:hypothetical protein